MAYTTFSSVENMLAQSMTSATTSTVAVGGIVPGKLTDIGRKMNTGTIPPEIVAYFIQQADDMINAALSQQYVVPLQEKCDLEMELVSSVDEYNASIQLTRAGALSSGDVLVFTDGTNTERTVVNEVIDVQTVSLVDSLTNLYDSANTRVLRVKFPDPIPLIATKIAAAHVYKKFFSAQADPNKTEYGELLLQEANDELNNIREGRTILHGIKRIGWRFANPELVARYNLKASYDQDGTRSNTGR